MPTPPSKSYHTQDGLERAVVDLVRVGTRGHGAGVRQLAARLMRYVPAGVHDTESFRDAVHKAIAAGSDMTELRYTSGTLPTEADSTHPLVDIDIVPEADGLALDQAVMSQLEEIIVERERAEELHRAGISLTRSILLSGPPGVGKTMTARWLARALELPLVSLDLSSVVSSYLGTSGRNIKSVLDYAKSGPCVLLLDEFDAIAKKRDDDADIGELKRIVNVILVELDRWPDTSLLVAATNHPQLLDSAAERRFDRSLTLSLPGVDQRRSILKHLATDAGDVDGKVLTFIVELTEGMTSSDLTRLWLLARRRAILASVPVADVLLSELACRMSDTGPRRDMLFLTLRDTLALSNRQIASVTGVSHPTVAAGIQRAEGARNGGRTG